MAQDARRTQRGGARLAVAVLCAGLIAGGLAFGLGAAGEMARLAIRLQAMTRGLGPAGWLAFGAAQTLVATIGFLPASLLAMAAGGLYGLTGGFALAATATMLGAILSFLISRSALRPWIEQRLRQGGRLRQLDQALVAEGWRLICLLRLNPVMPFAPTSFLLGLSGVSLRSYVLGTLAALPALTLYVALGSMAQDGARQFQAGGGRLHLALLAAGALATAALALRLGWLVRRVVRAG